MDDHGPRVADYFVLTGLTDDSKPLDEEIQNEGHIKPQRNLAPITDVHVIIRSQGEKVPPGFTCIEQTPFGFQADLNNGCIGSPSVFLCYRRGYDKPPLTDIGILYEGKSRLMEGCEVLSSTPTGLPANVNSRIGVSSQRSYITYRRAKGDSRHNTLAVIDIAVILTNKGESPPHAFNLINKNLNKGSMVGNDVYLCYKKSAIRGNSLVYEPALLSRYPPEDYPEFSLPDSVSKFCMPLGATLECWPSSHSHPLPLFSTFVLTDQGGAKVYGAGVTFYESYPESTLTEQQRESFNMKESQSYGIHTNKCICILSRWPFFDAFKKFLTFIYRLSLSGPLTVPIERYIAHFMHEVPFPTPQRPRIFMQLGHSSLILAQPQTSPLPLSGASFCALLQNLGPETCLNLLTYVLLESKILLHSLRPALLTAVAEAVSSMIFPFVWQCPYVPLCPLFLAMTLNAPFPVIFGIDSRYFDTYDAPSDATCVDIDTNSILLPDDKKGMTWKILPKKPAKKLLSMLTGLYREVLKSGIGDSVSDDLAVEMAPLDDDFNKTKKQTMLELKIQDAFLIFMASIMKDYNKYLLPITQQPTQRVTDADARFDCNGFIKSRDKASHVFFKQLSKTQQFIKLVEDVSFVTENDERFAFFEECTERVDAEGKEDVKLIDYDAVHDSEHTVFVTPPDETELEGMEFDYQGFPVLNPSLFLPSGVEGSVANRSSRNVFNSPFPRRTKQEMRQSQKMAKLQASSPEQWASYLLSQCYALWFLHLPSYVQGTHSKTRALKASFEVLKKIQGKNLDLVDEVCYRILMQLCGQYSQPVLAVQVFMEMRQQDVKINAITYGYYNKAVLESRWPASSFSGYQQWVKLRHTLLAVAQFKRPLKRRSYSDNSDVVSRSSGDSVDAEGRTEETPSATCTLTREEKSSTGHPNLLVDTGPSSNTSTPVNTTDNNSTLTNSLIEIDTTPKKVTVSRNSSIVRKSGGSSGSTSSVGRGNSGSSQSLNNPTSDQEDIGRRMYAMEVTMSTCCRCSQCRCLVYDEAIIAGWSADESKFQTSCCFCRAQWVPSLTMSIVDNRDQALRTRITQSPSSESVQSIQSAPFLKTEDNAQLSNDDELGEGQRSNPSIDNLSLGSEGDLLSSGPAISSKKEESKEQMTSEEQSDRDTVGPLLNLSGNENGLKDDKHGESRRSRSSSESERGESRRRGSVPDKKSSSGLKAGTSYSLPRYVKGIDEMDFHLSTSSLPTNIKGSRENIPLPRKDTEVSPVSVPYLSPLVLWKEVENVIENEGETCLKSPSFVSEHPIIFWNLVWYFNRLDLPNYMGGLLLAAYSELKGKTSHHLSTFTRYVKVHTMWENTNFWVELGPPMYMLWMSIGVVPSPFETRGFTKAFMLQIVKCIRYDNVHIPITMLLDEYKRLGVEKCERRGIYHDLLFLTFTALGRENIDQEAFDIKYRSACEKLPAEYKNQMQYDDGCPPMAVRLCNLTFGDLSLRTSVMSKD